MNKGLPRTTKADASDHCGQEPGDEPPKIIINAVERHVNQTFLLGGWKREQPAVVTAPETMVAIRPTSTNPHVPQNGRPVNGLRTHRPVDADVDEFELVP